MDPITLSTLASWSSSWSSRVPALVVWRKGRPAAAGEVFRASRLSGATGCFRPR